MTGAAFPVSQPGDGYWRSMLAWQALLAENLMRVQCSQLDMAMAWQESLRAIQQEMWDQWVCRFGGGVPLDG
ncbi:hypothetical protein [Variovorax sp. PBL-E5]|uniref:hypothetical protein n=1 Tax=Variovorax sp. PBL-E5 TaxID=434014 RepID=UPI0013160AB4|nr:hypothetical protein [Variovorax sp. PBL-E5]VTU22129.1 hypothetical protein E5CHR_01327 [Variovorax sp. PBL-E5]